MISGPFYWCELQHKPDGWHVLERGGNWAVDYGPYRWRWQARFMMWCVGP